MAVKAGKGAAGGESVGAPGGRPQRDEKQRTKQPKEQTAHAEQDSAKRQGAAGKRALAGQGKGVPQSRFPTTRSPDYYLVDELLTSEERAIRDKVRHFCDTQVIPVINDYWERAEFPFELIPKLAALNIAGGSISGYGCPGMSAVATGLVALELARGDASVCTFVGVHSGLAMSSIAMLGSQEQKQKWLPPMARMEKIGAFALTEPTHGSDAVLLETQARRDGDSYVLDGAKRWIGNASFSDVVIV